jgi:hypothetical protein
LQKVQQARRIGLTKLFGAALAVARKVLPNRKSKSLGRSNADQQSANEKANQQFTSQKEAG